MLCAPLFRLTLKTPVLLYVSPFQAPIKSLAPSTPLTNRRYLKEKDPSVTPVSTATQTVSRLQALLTGRKMGPSDELTAIFGECKENPAESISKRVKEMGEIFVQKYTQVNLEIRVEYVFCFAHFLLCIWICLFPILTYHRCQLNSSIHILLMPFTFCAYGLALPDYHGSFKRKFCSKQ